MITHKNTQYTFPATIPAPEPGLRGIVVIPCHNEPHALKTHRSLMNTQQPAGPIEILWVINASESSPSALQVQNQTTFDSLKKAISHGPKPTHTTHLIHCPHLPKKDAGVGLARRIGMDLAAQRLRGAGSPRGPILCLDADCEVSPNYLAECIRFFAAHPKSPGASIHFEHPLSGTLNQRIYAGIALYELHLRVYVHGLRWAGLPFAHQTVGSSMAVRANIYTAQGGMNKRKAGEDFYFLQKIIQLGQFGAIKNVTVFPSPRSSQRVPFGTGRAMGRWLDGDRAPSLTYPIRFYQDLRTLAQSTPVLRALKESSLKGFLRGLSPQLSSFLEHHNFIKKIMECQKNSRSQEAFQQRFFRFFDGFKVMKYGNFVREGDYGPAPVLETALQVLKMRGLASAISSVSTVNGKPSVDELLDCYRTLDKKT